MGDADSSVGGAEPDRTAARAAALGIDAALDEPFACILPGHGHDARLHPTPRGYWAYSCGRDTWGLGEIRAFLAYGTVKRINPVQAARWRERLDHDAGLLSPRPVLFSVPDRWPPSARRVADGMRLYLGLRHPLWEGQPFTFARAFAMAYCGVTSDEARNGVGLLEQAGIIERVDDAERRTREPIRWTCPPARAESAATRRYEAA